MKVKISNIGTTTALSPGASEEGSSYQSPDYRNVCGKLILSQTSDSRSGPENLNQVGN